VGSVPVGFFALGVRSTDPNSVGILFVKRLFAAAVVAAALVLAARATTAAVEQDRKQPAKYWNYDRRYDHNDVVLYDTAV
jgi:hypothetical protein